MPNTKPKSSRYEYVHKSRILIANYCRSYIIYYLLTDPIKLMVSVCKNLKALNKNSNLNLFQFLYDEYTIFYTINPNQETKEP